MTLDIEDLLVWDCFTHRPLKSVNYASSRDTVRATHCSFPLIHPIHQQITAPQPAHVSSPHTTPDVYSSDVSATKPPNRNVDHNPPPYTHAPYQYHPPHDEVSSSYREDTVERGPSTARCAPDSTMQYCQSPNMRRYSLLPLSGGRQLVAQVGGQFLDLDVLGEIVKITVDLHHRTVPLLLHGGGEQGSAFVAAVLHLDLDYIGNMGEREEGRRGGREEGKGLRVGQGGIVVVSTFDSAYMEKIFKDWMIWFSLSFPP